MPVNSQHPDYTRNIEAWTRIAHCLEGADAIKRAGVRYLPKLRGQDNEAYGEYQGRALFFNASARTHDAMLGFIFRKPPAHEITDDTLLTIMADADLSNAPLLSYARQVVFSTASTGRAGTMVDWSTDESRPYFAFYPELSILNWQEERVNGVNRLTLLVLLERQLTGSMADPYQASASLRYRELRLIDDKVTSTLYEEKREAVNGSQAAPGTGAALTGASPTPTQIGEPEILMRRGIPLKAIPFVFHGCETTGVLVDKPPLADITAVNISHYRTSADLENGRHICGTPTPYAICFNEDDKLYLGSSHAWTTDNPQASCGFLEFTGQGLSALEKAIQEKQGQMAALGARLIEPRGGDAEAYETVALRASAETSTLARITMLASEGITKALKIAAWWAGTSEEEDDTIVYSLNMDFTSAGIRPEMLTALTGAYQQGLISKDTLFHQLQRGEMFPEGWTKEAEWDAQEANPPLPPPGMVPPATKPKPTA